MRVFVTGASGFIGSAFARALRDAGHELTVLVRSPEKGPSGEGITQVVGDVASTADLDAAAPALEECDAVAHVAAVRKDWALSDEELRRANVESGPELMRRASRAQRFLFVSSVAVYGHHPEAGNAAEDAPFAPTKRYGVSKVEAEHALETARDEIGMPLTVVRPGITYGRGDTYGMVANLARLISRGRFLRVGSGRSRVNVLHVDDLARSMVSALTVPEAADEVFILTGVDAVPVGELIASVERAVGRRVPPVGIPEWFARITAWVMERSWDALGIESEPFLTRAKVDLFTRDDVYDTAKAQRVLGHAPQVELDAGLTEAVSWMREAGEL